MPRIAKNITIGLAFSLVLAFIFVPQLLAKDGESGGGGSSETTPRSTNSGKRTGETKTTEQSPEAEKSKENEAETKKDDNPESEARREVAREKLDDRKKNICKTNESAVNKAITNVGDRSQNHFDRITKIYDLTVTFYNEKGLSVSNYDELVAKVAATKVAAEAALADLKSTPKLSCDSDGPKADIQAFRNKRLDKVEAFGAYRDAVKAFVKAVREAAAATETQTPATEGSN